LVDKQENSLLLIFQELPKEAEVTRLEYEGPYLVIYVKRPSIITNSFDTIKKLAKILKKRIVVRADPSVRKNKEETAEIIRQLVGEENQVTNVKFDEIMGDVIVYTKRPVSKKDIINQKILAETNWRPVFVKQPPMQSKMLETVNAHLINEAEYRLQVLRQFGERIHRHLLFKNNYVRVTALGGFSEVGRSSVLLETKESKILLDLGVNPSSSWGEELFPRLDIDQVNLEELDAVIVTHAHLDHCGMVPLLFKYGYEGPVYVTKPTRDIMSLMQLDLLDVANREGEPLPYSAKEVRKMLLHTITLDYEEVTDITPDIRLTFYNAGHIIGSAMAHLHIGDGVHNIVYTGDFKFGRTRLLEKANTEFPRVDALIMETTYGAQYQPSRDEAESELRSLITQTISRSGRILIPVLAVGRAQEIMIVLNEMMKKKEIPEVPIYITGILDEITAIHSAYPDMLSREIKEALYNDENPFTSEHFHRIEGFREDIAKGEPSIILATSGMLNGGASVEFFKAMADDPKNTLIFVSYQAQGTLGRKLKNGERKFQMISKEGKVENIEVKMEVKSVEGFSGHSDKKQLKAFIANLSSKPKNIILNHGELEVIRGFARELEKDKRYLRIPNSEIIVPQLLDSIRLV